MKAGDRHHKWVEWSAEDGVCVGKCPDLITGIHGDDPVRLYGGPCAVADDVISRLESQGRPLPPACTRPMQEVA